MNPAFQGQGLSRLLMAEGEDRCRAAGCKFLDLTVVNLRLDLFPFYAKMGYAPSGTLPFPRPTKIRQACHLIEFTKPLRPTAEL